MAEYLGEKLLQVKKARSAERDVLSAECADLVLRIWDHRHSLPDGARPLASFESLFEVLNELSKDQARYSLLRDLPPARTGSKTDKIISGALALDRSVSSLIRYLLAEAVDRIPVKDKRWIKLRAATKELPWDIRLVIATTADAETLVGKKERLKNAEIKQAQDMLARLKDFQEKSMVLQTMLEDKLESLT